MAPPQHPDAEKHIQRNPHPDFKSVENSRPDWDDSETSWRWVKTKNPQWKPGDGASDGGESLTKEHVEIDPYAAGRAPVDNYKLLISGITPRFIGFLSTRSADGTSTNLAPMSYTTVVNHDPPVFVVGFASPLAAPKDSLRNLLDARECTLNVISAHFVEAANATAINAPYGTSEWAVSGLHPAPSTTVKPSRVKEAVFSVECVLMETREWDSRAKPGTKTGTTVFLEGKRFWVREDALNEQKNLIDPAVLRPASRLGGITYGTTSFGFEMPRPDWEDELKKGELEGRVKAKVEGQ